MPKKGRRDNNQQLDRLVDALDGLAEFEEFKRELLPALRKDLLSGLTPAQLREKYKSYAQARLIMNMLVDPDTAKSTTAAKDILDRAEGRPVEKQEHKHKWENLPEKQLDAALKSKLERAAELGLLEDLDTSEN